MARPLTPLAIAYDFDGTLSSGNMQERNFIPDIGMGKVAFWNEVKAKAKTHDMDEILAYLELMLEKAKQEKKPFHKKVFRDYGKKLTYFPGVEEWFDRINKYGKSKGVKVEHYIISSGLREMVDGCSIAKEFDYIFASGFRYDENDVACWPALAVNYTSKTQYLFRINKGILNSYDNSEINKYTPEEDRPVPFQNMVYIGDGETDVPAMKMVKYQGGHAIAVYPRKKGGRDRATQLVADHRADYAVPADYSKDKELDEIIHAIIDKVAAERALNDHRRKAKAPVKSHSHDDEDDKEEGHPKPAPSDSAPSAA